ncbi:hypothetical protein [Kutzneria kofuensis]|jgi:hypothetical protein|uniref:ANTAR domain-containing protein n=1 Tax=Kutzneria kofuensis TaxID=103725 RepID=A0A7W9KP41_9PSEU|nr:hypothetical protein [Kutzneria kofuensis]MBB5896144.1 hypothetical protein [Kutzneria kofuensis]
MGEFVATLHDRVQDVQADIRQARRVGDGYREQLFSGRLVDLLAVARRHGVDMSGWVESDILATLPDGNG